MRPLSAFRSAAVCLPLFLVLAGAAPGPAPVDPHEQAARELYRLIGGADLASSGADAMMEVFRQNPEMAPYEDVFRQWFRKVFAESAFEEEMIRVYKETFSEKELREITAFYKTPLGQRLISSMPEMMKKGAELGMKYAEEHSAELMEMLEKAREEREKLPAATDQEAQKRTVSHLRNVGTAMFSWLTDQVGAGAAGQSQTDTEEKTQIADLDTYEPISREELEKILVPDYIQEIPETDGWGHPYEYYLNVKDPMAAQVMGIRSPGRDGKYSTDSYTVGSFDPTDYDEDIVWMDGFFARWPQKEEPKEM